MDEQIDAINYAIDHLKLAKEEIKGLYDDEVAEIEYTIDELEKELEYAETEQIKIWDGEIKALNNEYERGALRFGD